VVSYDPCSGTTHLDYCSTINIGKAMTEEEEEPLPSITGASDEAIALAELSFIMLRRFNKQEKLTKQDFDAVWYAHVNLTTFWKAALSTEGAPRNGKLN
jgi:hypothetical protein